MSARPWMPLHIPDYLADTAHLGALESGAYLHLIFHYWQTGGLPDEPSALARIAKISAHSWKKLSPVLQKFFHDGWKHKRVDKELAKVEEISTKRKAAAEQMHRKRAANAPASAEQKHTHPQPHPQPQEEQQESSSLRSVALVEQKPKPESDWPATGFDQFWKTYPHKVGKQAALRAFAKAKRSATPWARVVSALDQYIREKPIDRAWCNPATWLNEGRYDDEPAKNGGGNNGFRGSRSFQDDSRSVTKAIDRRLEQAEQLSFPPRPSLMPQEREADRRLLPPGRSTEPGTVR